jgi:hypothetical protein
MSPTRKTFKYYGYEMEQNPSNDKLKLYVCGIDAQELRSIVSVDNAVQWDPASGVWRTGGRNRTIEQRHWIAIKDFLSASNQERILPSAIVISVKHDSFRFEPFAQMPAIARVRPGVVHIDGLYDNTPDGETIPVEESARTAWVLDGQHRITAFRDWTMPDPYPVNVIVIVEWQGQDYEDVMRHQTYELNMGRPLSEDFKASIREQYDRQVGHPAYKEQIALSWIRRDLEGRGWVFSAEGIVGAPNLRTPYVITLSFLESLIKTAFEHDAFLKNEFPLQKITKSEVSEVGKYLYDFYEGVRLSLGLLNPNTKGTIGTDPKVESSTDYWDIAAKTKHKQRILHNVGLKAVTRGLLNAVMRGQNVPQSPAEVAKMLDHMRGIPWHSAPLQSKKDDWVTALGDALLTMYRSKGTKGGKKYTLNIQKKDPSGNVIDSFALEAYGWV